MMEGTRHGSICPRQHVDHDLMQTSTTRRRLPKTDALCLFGLYPPSKKEEPGIGSSVCIVI